jgi:predicted neuraminidase
LREHRRPKPAIVFSEFVFTSAPFRHCHASTLVELPGGTLLSAWFGGEEGDRSVAIWGARRTSNGWTPPFELAREPGVPTWNPVLFVDRGGTIWLFYRYGASQHSWAGAYRTSKDGVNWSGVRRLP